MPWKINENGEREYVVSIYTKEELPTWAEVYEDFYKGRVLFYDPNDESHQKLDTYWKIPKRKYILAIICNQFNKMLFEENMKNSIIESIHNMNIIDIRFIIDPIKKFDDIINVDINEIKTEIAPPIYTMPLPNGKKNPFIINKHKRININKLDKILALSLLVTIEKDQEPITLFISPIDDQQTYLYDKIMKKMMYPYIEYFEGSGIGWKDENGNIMELDPLKRNCSGAGYDPAL